MGSVVLSVDAELGWGFHDYDAVPTDRVEAAREGWRHLVALLDEYRVPATWAVVGHLFLEECDGRHADHPAPPGWFARERGDWRDRPDLRFAPDLLDALLGAEVDHDVGSHTFSHVVASDARVTPDVVRAELAASVAASRAHGVRPRSFVFPRNAVGYRDLLAEFGFTAYRGARDLPPPGLRRSFDKLASAVAPGRASLVDPAVDEHGLVDVPPSLYLFGFEGRPRDVIAEVWADPVVLQARHGIDRAAREDGVFHLWLHPNNLVTGRDVRRVRSVLEYLDRRRAATGLTVETMRDVADRVG